MRKIGIVGGTGIENPDTLKGFETKIIETPYGKALCNIGEMSGNLVAFLSRHGVDHSVAPHMINYRANIWALKSLGITEVFATSATGSLNPNMKAGHFVVCDQLMDFTKNRISTFYDNPIRGVAHADFTNPYCETLRQKAIAILKKTDITFHEKGCYVCTDGPRFETAAGQGSGTLLHQRGHRHQHGRRHFAYAAVPQGSGGSHGPEHQEHGKTDFRFHRLQQKSKRHLSV